MIWFSESLDLAAEIVGCVNYRSHKASIVYVANVVRTLPDIAASVLNKSNFTIVFDVCYVVVEAFVNHYSNLTIVIDVCYVVVEAFVNNSSDRASIVDVCYVVVEAFVNNSSNTPSWGIVYVLYVVVIDAKVMNRSNNAAISDVVNIVRTFLSLAFVFSFNQKVSGTWFPRDLGQKGEEEVDCKGKECHLERG